MKNMRLIDMIEAIVIGDTVIKKEDLIRYWHELGYDKLEKQSTK